MSSKHNMSGGMSPIMARVQQERGCATCPQYDSGDCPALKKISNVRRNKLGSTATGLMLAGAISYIAQAANRTPEIMASLEEKALDLDFWNIAQEIIQSTPDLLNYAMLGAVALGSAIVALNAIASKSKVNASQEICNSIKF